MVTKDGKTAMSFGVMGGYYQAMGHAHLISKVVDYGMDMQDAIDLPGSSRRRQGPAHRGRTHAP